MKYSRFSFPSRVSGALQILHVTYSTTQISSPHPGQAFALTDVLPEHVLNLLLRVSPLHHQSLGAVHGPLCTQLRVEEVNDVLRLPVHPSADVGKIREDGLLRALTSDLWRDNGVSPFLTGELGIVGMKEGEEAFQ